MHDDHGHGRTASATGEAGTAGQAHAKVLVTGFEPFGGETVNSSWEAVRLLADAPPAGTDLRTEQLSCVFGTAAEELRRVVRETGPDLVLCVGEAGGRTEVTVERVALNVDDARIPDNAGRQPVDDPVVADGPAAYLTALPVKACVRAVQEAGVPASVSQTAGTFVCNHVSYALAHLIATERPGLRGGFVHLPLTPAQAVRRAGQPSMSPHDSAAALSAVITAALTTTEDLRVTGGATH